MTNETIQIRDEREFLLMPIDIGVWKDNRLSTVEKSVYTSICTFAFIAGGSCQPTISQIAQRASCSGRSVKRALKTLEDLNYLTISKRMDENGQSPSSYWVKAYHNAR